MSRVAVIGAGIAGMAAAARLAALGVEVHLYDKRLGQGGPVTTVTQGPYTFDVGPQYLSLPVYWDELFAACGERRESYFSLSQLDTLFRVHIPGAGYVDVSRDIEATQDSLHQYGCKNPQAYKQFLQLIAATAPSCTTNPPMQYPWQKPKKMVERTVVSLKRTATSDYVSTAIDSVFTPGPLADAFKLIAAQHGIDPYRAPAASMALLRSTFDMGLFYPDNGMAAVVKGLGLLCSRKGVKYIPGATIDRIMVSGNRVVGVSVHKNIHDYDAVLATGYSAIDPSLLKHNSSAGKRIPASADMVFLLGVKQRHENFLHNNIVLSGDVASEFANLHDRRLPEEPSCFVAISSNTNRKMAPGVCENWYVRTKAPWVEIEDDTWDLEKSRVLRKVFQVLQLHGVSIDHLVETKTSFSPADFEHSFLQWRGTGWGMSVSKPKNSTQYASLKHPHIEGLFSAGTFVPPGPGVSFALLSASRAATMCAKSLGVNATLDKHRFVDLMDNYV